MTTKKDFIKRAMLLRPSEKDWREAINKAIKAGCLRSFDDMPDNFHDAYPLAAAILHGYLKWYLDGSSYERERRLARREMKNICKFI